MNRLARLAILSALTAMALVAFGASAGATPLYSVDSSHACNTCHVEPIGWENPDYSDRRCSLDCQGCHISPTGGGARTPLGQFYGREILAMFGGRPSATANPMQYLQDGAPSEGRYSLFGGGFEGWWPGDVAHRDIDDRYGSINPSPTWQVGSDIRMAIFDSFSDEDDPSTEETEGNVVWFPMELQLYLATHPTANTTVYADIGYQGRRDSVSDNAVDRIWLREAFVMLHDLPYAGYVRAGHFNLPYGWRIPDHTAFIRKGMFDQYRQGTGIEVGFAPNEGWANLMLYTQGIDAWPGDVSTSGYGVTAQGGVRFLGYQLGMSAHFMSSTDDATPSEAMFGPLWGVNAHPFIYLGEIDFRRTFDGNAEAANQLFAYHEIRYTGVTGFTPFGRMEWRDLDLTIRDDHANRFATGFDFNPYRYMQITTLLRHQLAVGDTIPGISDLMIQFHFYPDGGGG